MLQEFETTPNLYLEWEGVITSEIKHNCFKASYNCFTSVVIEDPGLFNCAILDTACTFDIAGTIWVNKYEDSLRKLGIKFKRYRLGPGVEYDFGGDTVGGTLGLYSLPAWPYGKFVWLTFYLITGGNPYLASFDTVGIWGVIIDKPNNQVRVDNIVYEMKRSKNAGHLLVPLLPTECDTIKCLPAHPVGLKKGSHNQSFIADLEVRVDKIKSLPGIYNQIHLDPIIQHLNRRRRLDIIFHLGRLIRPRKDGNVYEDSLYDAMNNKGRELLLETLADLCKSSLDFTPHHVVIGWKVKEIPISAHAKKVGVFLLAPNGQYKWIKGTIVGSPLVSLADLAVEESYPIDSL